MFEFENQINSQSSAFVLSNLQIQCTFDGPKQVATLLALLLRSLKFLQSAVSDKSIWSWADGHDSGAHQILPSSLDRFFDPDSEAFSDSLSDVCQLRAVIQSVLSEVEVVAMSFHDRFLSGRKFSIEGFNKFAEK